MRPAWCFVCIGPRAKPAAATSGSTKRPPHFCRKRQTKPVCRLQKRRVPSGVFILMPIVRFCRSGGHATDPVDAVLFSKLLAETRVQVDPTSRSVGQSNSRKMMPPGFPTPTIAKFGSAVSLNTLSHIWFGHYCSTASQSTARSPPSARDDIRRYRRKCEPHENQAVWDTRVWLPALSCACA